MLKPSLRIRIIVRERENLLIISMISILAWNSIDLDIKNSYKLFPRLIKLNWISLLFIVWTRNGGIIITGEAIYSYHFLSCILSRNLQLFVAQYVGIYHVDLHLPSNNHRINPSLLRHSFWHYLRTKHALFHHYKSSTSLLLRPPCLNFSIIVQNQRPSVADSASRFSI